MNDVCSIIMVTFNKLHFTQKTLDNLFKTAHFPFHLILIDNNSCDGTQEYLKKFCESKKDHEYLLGYQIEYNKVNYGTAVGRNQGLCLVNKEDSWIAILDHDILFPDYWLMNCVQILKQNKKYGIIGVNFEKQFYPIIKSGNYSFQYKNQGYLQMDCAVFSRGFHQSVGYFNTEYLDEDLEEADFGIRAKMFGYEFGYLKQNGRCQEKREHVYNNDDYLNKLNENYRLYAEGRKPIYFTWNYTEIK